MNNFETYAKIDFTPVKGQNCWLQDEKGDRYLDLYGGHAVISIGHSHLHYIQKIEKQLSQLGYYSNAVENSLQNQLAMKLGKLSGYSDYALFMCNSGAEAVENALKLASFQTGRSKILSFKKSFHGRTSGALGVTDNPGITAPINHNQHVHFIELNDFAGAESAIYENDFAGVIIEGIQGISGINIPEPTFLEHLQQLCQNTNTLFIVDEVQSGYGRTGKFFAHQYSNVRPHLIAVAKGMGNGFPVGGVLISPEIEARKGMLGSTFGGNHLACAAAYAVLEILESEGLMNKALTMEKLIRSSLEGLVKEIRGYGLMLGLEFPFLIKPLKDQLFAKHKILVGNASNPHVIRLLPPLTVSADELGLFISALKSELIQINEDEKIHIG